MARITIRETHLRETQKLALPLTNLKGVGPRRALLLAQKGLYTILDLLFFTPIRYEDRTRISYIGDAEEGIPVLVMGKVLFGREEIFFPRRKRLFKIVIQDSTGNLELLWFHYRKPHLARFSSPNIELLIYGTIKINRGKRQMVHPEITIQDTNGVKSAGGSFGFYPVYSSVKGISNNIMRSLIGSSLDDYLGAIRDPIPGEITHRLNLPNLARAIRYVHLPPGDSSIDTLNQCDTPAHKRLIFDRFFFIMLAMAFRKGSRERISSPIFSIPSDLMKTLGNVFPFRLTSHQLGAVEDIIRDMTRGRPMNRLLLGDVGCGKTVVAAVAALLTIQNRRQVALMVPTQVLANQHMEFFSSLSEPMGLRPVLLSGNLKKIQRRDIYNKIRNGWYNLIIGTHSLIQEEVSFYDLGLVIIDEQHRFGVRQRALMDRKGKNPHQLIMTATPIPRTLAITLYGDMDISMIKQYPEGHRPVVTRLIERGQKKWVFETLKKRMSEGQQAFVICPVIEDTEDLDLKSTQKMAQQLRKILTPPYKIGLIHGRLFPEEREKTMDNFRKGNINLLVGTTVIEVGIHVPRATVMIIEHPERFGLAQLHQLRGRVGRGSQEGICMLMLSSEIPERAISRLKTLAESHDGFDIAQKDLELRGHGEFTGMKQAGMGELDVSEMIREQDLLFEAKREAQRLIEADPELCHPENLQLKLIMESVLARPLDL
jgi:ATP-dependent DNA helicase RecG